MGSHPGFHAILLGGGIMGLATAHFLKRLAPTMEVAVVERDPTYEFCSTPRASGGCRVQFSCPENIRMSRFSIDFIRDFPQAMRTGSQEAPVDWVEGGYLLIAEPQHLGLLESNHAIQVKEGCVAHLLDASALKSRWPSMRVDDLAAGVHTPHDGWCDPSSLLQGFRRKCVEQGVRFIHDEVVRLEVAGKAVRAATLKSGARLVAEQFVNTAGAWSGQVAAMAGMPLPVSPLRRFEHYFTCGNPMERLPYVKDLARMAFRSEGSGFSGGVVDGDEPRGFNFDVDHDWFERVVWPAAAHRFPPLESARCHRTWSGLYEQCELDGNPIIGPWRGGLDNFHQCSGFSGHGMMHAPAAGRAVAELVVHGEFRSLDLSRFGYDRVVRNAPYAERGIL